MDDRMRDTPTGTGLAADKARTKALRQTIARLKRELTSAQVELESLTRYDCLVEPSVD